MTLPAGRSVARIELLRAERNIAFRQARDLGSVPRLSPGSRTTRWPPSTRHGPAPRGAAARSEEAQELLRIHAEPDDQAGGRQEGERRDARHRDAPRPGGGAATSACLRTIR